ncbi:hypothetical protein [Streptomyces sp. NBC_01022]|uniref:hypothetical protein n=1 Tax=Streptomyces sp. NBC_01022 TaxID=2903723 RepID=UPI002DD8B59D|nr:hypothetical protein [Streptomyces sp. NBC_01022]WRZ86094.1 hypothetical protein OG316_40365 [Streptomyces sp. NBC_01022]
MTHPHADSLLFDVPVPVPPVEQLLLLAGQYTLHNDTLDLALASPTEPDPAAHGASARQLATETSAAITAVLNQHSSIQPDLSDTLIRLNQLAYLSAHSADQKAHLARELTALAPQDIVTSAARIAQEPGRDRSGAPASPAELLTPAHCAALYEVARGRAVVTESMGRQYVNSRGPRILISTLRHLESNGLVDRAEGSAAPAFKGAPPLDRLRLTPAGATAVASFIGLPPATTAASSRVVPPAPVQSPSRSR